MDDVTRRKTIHDGARLEEIKAFYGWRCIQCRGDLPEGRVLYCSPECSELDRERRKIRD